MDFNPTLLLWIPALLFSLSVHEFAHAWSATKGGDLTAKHEGRLTLNPISHIDLFGTIILPGILLLMNAPLFGWARPVPFRENFLRKPVWVVWVALAGPASNFIMAFITMLILKVALMTGGAEMLENLRAGFGEGGNPVVASLLYLALIFIQLNLILGIFNLLPFPPLDGSKLLYHWVVRGSSNQSVWDGWNFLNQYGFILLYLLIALPGVRGFLFTLFEVPLDLTMRFLAL